MTLSVSWPRLDYSRVPYRLFHDPEIHRIEGDRIFRGPVWLLMGLEAEIPNPGDFRTTWLGETPVVYNRGRDGAVYAFVNRCAHRGAIVRREKCGNAINHVCIYHRWAYNLRGDLIGVPFERGIDGKGGLPDDFDKGGHGLQKLRVASVRGLLFATFSEETEPVESYFGEFVLDHIDKMMQRPIRVLGYQRQRIKGNWKLYSENLKDNYHGPLLHDFNRALGLSRSTQEGGSRMDDRHRHHLTYAKVGSDSDEKARQANESANIKVELKLHDARMLRFIPERNDGISLGILSLFPNGVLQQHQNSLATRQLRPKGVDEMELFWTHFGYADDTEEMTRHRMRQSNMNGPAGYVSMEDGEACEIVHKATKEAWDSASVVEVGGRGEIGDRAYRVNDVPIRGFWSYYSELMGIEPDGAVR